MPVHHVVVRWIAWRWAIGPGQERLSPAGRPSPKPAHGRGAVPVVVPSPAHVTEPVLRHTALGQCPRDGVHATVPAPVPVRREHLLGVVVNWPSVGLTDDFARRAGLYAADREKLLESDRENSPPLMSVLR